MFTWAQVLVGCLAYGQTHARHLLLNQGPYLRARGCVYKPRLRFDPSYTFSYTIYLTTTTTQVSRSTTVMPQYNVRSLLPAPPHHVLEIDSFMLTLPIGNSQQGRLQGRSREGQAARQGPRRRDRLRVQPHQGLHVRPTTIAHLPSDHRDKC